MGFLSSGLGIWHGRTHQPGGRRGRVKYRGNSAACRICISICQSVGTQNLAVGGRPGGVKPALYFCLPQDLAALPESSFNSRRLSGVGWE